MDFKKLFVKTLEKRVMLLLIVIVILIIILLYINEITSFINKKLSFRDNFNNIEPNDPNMNKYSLLNEGKEGFETKEVKIENDTKSDTVMSDVYNRNYNVMVEPRNRSVKVTFNKVQLSELDKGVKELGYLVVLAKYNNMLQKIGHVDAKISNEGIDIEDYLNKYNNLFPTDEIKDEIRNITRDLNVSDDKISTKILDIFIMNSSDQVSLNLLNTNEKQHAYVDLLEILYDSKYHNKALYVVPGLTYESGIIDLYNDLLSLNISELKNINELNIQKQTPNTTFNDDVNLEDTKYELILQNRQDAANLKNELKPLLKINNETKKIIIDFLFKYINKYENLSMSNDIKTSKGICSKDGNCTYTFENLEDKDSNGNFYYYKLGFGLIYNKGTDSYVEEVSRIHTYKFGNGGRMMYFKLDNSLEEQERLLKRLEDIERSSILSTNKTKNTQPLVNNSSEDNNNDIDAYMKMLKPHIGNYPDEFTLREQDVNDLSLSDYINKSVNRGQINIDVNIVDDIQYPKN